MADYYAILKRAIGGLAEPTGESRRSIYEKARTALVAQLKSFDPPLSASEITQQRLQLEDAIRKVESESAKGLLSQALSRATAPTTQITGRPAVEALPEPTTGASPPVTSERPPLVTRSADRGQTTGMTTGQATDRAPTTMTSSIRASAASALDREVPARPPAPRATDPRTQTTTQITGATTGPTPPTGRAQTVSVARPPEALERPPRSMPVPTKATTRQPSVPPGDGAYDQEDVTQPVSSRILKKAVTDIDRLGTATQETARRARDALAATDTPLDEDLSTGGRAKAKGRGNTRPLGRPPADLPGRTDRAPTATTAKSGSRLPVIIGLVVAATVVTLGATALYMKRDLIASYIGSQKPPVEVAQRAPSEKPVVKSSDRLLPDDGTAKPAPNSGVKVVTTQPITAGTDPSAAPNPGGRTDVAPGTSATPADQPAPAATTGEVPPIAQKATLLEEAADGTSAPIQTIGKVLWQVVKSPSPVPGKPDVIRLQGRVEIPQRGIVMFVTMEQNTDAGLQASHLIKLEFKLPADFDNKSVARVPGMIMKTAEQARGDPLAGATAKITSNLFWIALYSADTDKARNLQLMKDRGWIDIPIVYETNKRAMLTLEKAGAGDRVFNDAMAGWSNGG